MLSKNRKIPKDLFSIFKQKRAYFVSNDIFSCKYLLYDGKQALFSFSISKKIDKNATTRNKLKRICFDVIKGYVDMQIKPFLIWFSWKKKETNKLIIKKAIEDILNKIK